jgi:hypothetical protein
MSAGTFVLTHTGLLRWWSYDGDTTGMALAGAPNIMPRSSPGSGAPAGCP